MKGRKHRAEGGVVDKDESPKDVYAGKDSPTAKEAVERKKGGRVAKGAKPGGKVEGKMSKMRLDRPGRKRGGRVGADKAPLSSAASVSDRPGMTGGGSDCD